MAKSAGGARYFEFSEGSSNKFWEISIDGSEVTTRYGKIGTDGQMTLKDFGAKAQAEYDKLVKEKTKKGYVEKKAGGGAAKAAPAKAAPAPTKAAAAKPEKAAAAPASAGGARYFEFSDGGSSNKFWEISIDGSEVTTRYGKIGTDGQSTLKDFGGKAQAEYDKLVKEKTKKGYVEKKAGGAKAAPAKAAPAPKAKAAPAKAAPAPKAAAPKAAKKSGGGARYFEFSEGSSNKFWEISIDGSEVTTRYGKIGTPGQSTLKDFGAKAQAEYDKLIKEKTKKGYQES